MPEAPESSERPLLPKTRLDELLVEVQARLEDALSTRDRIHSLLEAVVSIGGDLDLATVLRRLTEAAARLVDARYAGLGVLDGEGGIAEFIPIGMTDEQVRGVTRSPEGRGLLAHTTRGLRPLRLSSIEDHPDFGGFPEGHPPMRTFLGVPVQVRGEVFGNLYLTEKHGGGEFDEDDEAVVTALATAAGVAIANARLYEDSRRRERWLSASTEITTRLLSGAAAEDVLGHLAEQARRMAGADVAVVLLPDADGSHLVAEIIEGDGGGEVLGAHIPVEGTECGGVYRSGTAVTIPDLREATPPLFAGQDFRPGLLVPLGAPGHTRGVLLLGREEPRTPFDSAARGVLTAFSGQAAVALDLAEARRDAERLVVLEDRDRIAKDLHDIVIQRLFASAMTLMSTIRLIADPEAGERVQHTIDDLDGTIREIRSTVFALQTSPVPRETSLRGRILGEVESAARVLPCRPGVALDGPIDASVPGEAGEQLLAVLREALSNVARHAHAGEVHVSVDASGGTLRLEVADDGVGITGEGRRSGLRNMADRAEALGGRFTTAPRPGGGTVLEWTVPVAGGADAPGG
ncbi:sensor histidine kinase [Actinorugispora endophytica]|uniref:Histidine kinase/DNA gyrase B/HSP90-like ATPase n=1 Tax=Actinorugispora endophytica TaxID=1605990 RepID=A0A4R6V1E8_9ACTN|nr:GAF domain-containing sensor histidine kinase [Actinorugispora endophytica]TDQ52212.1 histidine kinase/DNA gyrase B/HSP90-like ATPase [Actinorugispora endophytica]